MARGYVYFIQAETNGFIKIGWTDNHPSLRLKQLEMAAPCPLIPLGAIRGERHWEGNLHNRFGHLRSHSEWFRPGPDLLLFIEKKAKPWPERGAYEADTPGEEEWRKRQAKWLDEMSQWALFRIKFGHVEEPVWTQGYWG